MTSADMERGDQLNDYLDARSAGKTPKSGDLDQFTQEAVERFFSHDDAPAPRAGLASQILEDIMNQSAYAGAIPQVPSFAAPQSLNGRIAPQAPQRPMARPKPVPAQRRRFIAQMAVAALLLMGFAFGFHALDPFGSGSEQPSSIPAVVAPAAPPTATPYPMTDHPFIGVWKWSVFNDPGCCAPGIADADGTYINYDPGLGGGVGIGTWREPNHGPPN